MVNTEEITRKRLAGWERRLSESHATPLVMIGVSHDQKSGQIVLCLPEGVDDELLVSSLRYALGAIESGAQVPQHHGESSLFDPNRN